MTNNQIAEIQLEFNFDSSRKLLKILFSVLLFNLFACSKTPESNQIIPTPTPNPTPTRPSNIIDKSPKYSSINNTTSIAYSNKMFPGFYYTLEKASAAKFQINEFNLINADYRFNDFSRCFLDFNQDGYLDLFAFLSNFKNQPWSSQNGKFMLVNDVLGSTPKITYVDANWKWGSRMKIIDINKDGHFEVISGNEEDHQLSDGTYGKPSPFQIISVDKNGNIITQLVGEAVSTHAQTFGDIDNDGDIDIITWRNAYTNLNNEDLASYPVAYINNGTGNFTQDDSFKRFKNLDKLIPIMSNGKRMNYAMTAIELFDVDGDNILDLVASYTNNQTFPSWEYGHTATRIYWGQTGGNFDFLNSYTDLPKDYLNGLGNSQSINVGQLGFSFWDYDNDRDIDIFVVSTPDYGGYILQLCENTGGKQFQDVTSTKFDKYYNIYPRNTQPLDAFPAFYSLRIYDKDGDGDFDLVPDAVGSWGLWQNPISQNLYWENNGGIFILKK